MAFLSLTEVFDIVVMSLVIGFIFKDVFRPHLKFQHPDELLKNVTPGLKTPRLNEFWYAVLLVAPAIIFHEFGHKFVAMAFGLSAEFHAAYTWLVIGVLLKLFMPGFVFFVPAYVSYPAIATAGQSTLIAFAGPAVNGVFWLGSYLAMKHLTLKKDQLRYLALFRRINGFLFILNMIPIPGFDGYHVIRGLAAVAGMAF